MASDQNTTGTQPSAVVTIGETMAMLTAPNKGLRSGSSLPIGIGGAESNVAIGLARLGVPSTWISRLGADSFGTLIARELRAEGVRVIAAVDPDAPTGMMVKEHRDGKPWRVRYYRNHSAAAQLSPADLNEAAIIEADVLHLTGITPALGPGPLLTIQRAIEIADAADTLVSFDVNYRSTLWSPQDAADVLSRLTSKVDLLFAGPEEAALLLGVQPPSGTPTFEDGEDLARGLAKMGPATVVVKLGALGSMAVQGDQTFRAATQPITVVDAVGAGDAFVAGYLSELVAGRAAEECLRMGNTLGGAVCQQPGDWEGLPTREELNDSTVTGEVVR